MSIFHINEVDRVEVVTLQDNYVDMLSQDNNHAVKRAMPIDDNGMPRSLLAEHGFSALFTTTKGEQSESILFDFGFSDHGATSNLDILNLDLQKVCATVLSHGHPDHTGGMEQLMGKIKQTDLELVLHPAAFRSPRYIKLPKGSPINMPPFTRKRVTATGAKLVESKTPYPLLKGDLLFLGEIPRKTSFERGLPGAYYKAEGTETPDDIADDTAIAANVRGCGLVILSGCGHAGIINTINYARSITGIDAVFAVMGGFHLAGPQMAPVIEPTVNALKEINPTYVIPTHCTGRDAVSQIEKAMPGKFILNMVGTTLTFSSANT